MSFLKQMYFIGGAFRDLLYHHDSQSRERAVAWKLARSMRHVSCLSNDWWSWAAIGIPLDLLSQDQPQGDIDLLIARPDAEYIRLGGSGAPPQQYRTFELKVGIISRFGKVKSLKLNKFKRISAQLNKLVRYGVEQLFLLDAYVVQAGFSDSGGRLPSQLIHAVDEKADKLKGSGIGHVLQLLEQIPGYHEEMSEIGHVPINVLPAPRTAAGPAFLCLVRHVEAFIEANLSQNQQWITIVAYCSSCKDLTIPASYEAPVCHRCDQDLIHD